MYGFLVPPRQPSSSVFVNELVAPSALPRRNCYADDLALAARCQCGDETAVKQVIAELDGRLKALLVRRGASETVAGDLVEDLWGDCFSVGNGSTALLSKYSGRSRLSTWLTTVLTRRWLDRWRVERRFESGERRNGVEKLTEAQSSLENELTVLLRETLCFAFDKCDPETFVMLQIVYVHGVSQRDVGRAWGISEFAICRKLSKAMAQIRSEAAQYLRTKDPALHLGWDEIIGFCASSDVLFPG